MHLIPAAGSATRFGGIPKYLLPCIIDGKSMLRIHIEASLQANLGEIRVAIHPTMYTYVSELFRDLKNEVTFLSTVTSTMTETIKVAFDYRNVTSKCSIISLPDTFNTGMMTSEFSNKLSELRDSGNSLLAWKMEEKYRGKLGQILISDVDRTVLDIRDKDPYCNYDSFWGALSIDTTELQSLDPSTPTIGSNVMQLISAGVKFTGVRIPGRYFDCGDFKSYVEMLKLSE